MSAHVFNSRVESGDRKGAHGCAICLAFIYRAQGKTAKFLTTLQDAFGMAFPGNDSGAYLHLTRCFGTVYAQAIHARKNPSPEDFIPALEFLGFTEQAARKFNPIEYAEHIQKSLQELQEMILQHLSLAEVEAAWEEGRKMSVDEVVALALSIKPEELFAEQMTEVAPVK